MARVNVPVTEITQPKATLTTSLTGTHNDLKFTAKKGGPWGNSIAIVYSDPGGVSADLSVSVAGFTITVSLGRASSAINSTATQVKNAIQAWPDAAALVTVELASSNDGSGVVTALSSTSLSGGALGLELPAETTGDATNDMYITGNAGDVVIKARNSGASSRTIDFHLSPTASAGVAAGRVETITVDAGDTVELGPFASSQYNQNSDGEVWFDPAHADLVFRAYKITTAS
jgi:hypothetical protein